MNNRVCPKCGEEYSATYRTCPFCEEEAALAHGTPIHRRGGKRVEKRRRSGGAGGVMLLVTGVIIVGVVGYLLLGDRIQDTMGIRDPAPVSDAGGEPVPEGPDPASQTGAEDPPEVTAPPADEDPAEPTPLALNFTNIRIDAGDKGLLSASGGTGGDVTWTSSNEHIATVENGSVTGVAGGDAVITATRGEESVSCTVTVLGDPYVSDLKLKLNKTDFTWGANDTLIQLKILFQGTGDQYDGVVTWASSNTNVVTVSDTGGVSKAGKGTTTVTATVEGQVLECIVRVP